MGTSAAGGTAEGLIADWQHVTSGVARVQHRVDSVVEAAGVPAQWFAVLYLLRGAAQHRMPMTALAREVSMSSGGFTKLADRMAREGLIDRRGSADDRRVVHAMLTDKGIATAQRATEVYGAALREAVLGVVSAQQLADAAAVLDTLRLAHADADSEDPESSAATAMLVNPRDPALPDRRERGRTSS